MSGCPGQDSRFWKPEDICEIACGHCGMLVEFFKTDGVRTCPHCAGRVVNPQVSIGCAQWCEHAKECLGYDPKAQSAGGGAPSLVEQLLAAMEAEFGDDAPRIAHARQVLDAAQEILRTETSDPRVVLAAAVLHDIGIQEAERQHGSAAAEYQEREGPPIAKRIMLGIGLDMATVAHVCRIVGSHHSAGDIDTPEFRIIWDADWLVNFPDAYAGCDADRQRELVASTFRTEAGRRLAGERFLGEIAV